MKWLVLTAFLGLCACQQMSGPEHDAIEAVKRSLKYPYTAKFDSVAPCPENKNIYRGKVNSKNEFGAYTGSSEFYVMNGVAYLDTDVFEKSLREMGYSFMYQLVNACYYGREADLKSYLTAVEAGTAPTLLDQAAADRK